jgi:hypothetical protein
MLSSQNELTGSQKPVAVQRWQVAPPRHWVPTATKTQAPDVHVSQDPQLSSPVHWGVVVVAGFAVVDVVVVVGAADVEVVVLVVVAGSEVVVERGIVVQRKSRIAR